MATKKKKTRSKTTRKSPRRKVARTSRSRKSATTSYWSYGLVAGIAVACVVMLLTGKMPGKTAGTETASTTTESRAAPEPMTARAPAATSASNAALMKRFAETRGMSLTQKMNYWSLFFVKGDGGAIHQLATAMPQPDIQDDATPVASRFDCTTFVETVAALARSDRPEDFYSNLFAIRYRDGKTEYLHRNHFPEADWIPNNVQARILKDVTASVAGDSGVKPRTEGKEIYRGKWLAEQLAHGRVGRSIATNLKGKLRNLGPEWNGSVHADVTYVSMKDLDRALDHIPDGAVINLVRKADNEHPVLITHQGLAFHQKGVLYFRHASATGHILSVPMKPYLIRYAKNHANAGWPLVGINIDEVRD